MKIHPYANTWPMLSGKKLDTLTHDIETNGLKIKIVCRRLADGSLELLDGRNRVEALKRHSIEPTAKHIEEITCPDDEVKALIDSLNKERRHMTDEALKQQAASGASVAKMAENSEQSKPTVYRKTKAERRQAKTERNARIMELHAAGWKQGAIAQELSISQQTVGRVIQNSQNEKNGSSPKSEPKPKPKPKPKPSELSLSAKKTQTYAIMQAAASYGATVEELAVRHNVTPEHITEVLKTPLPPTDSDLMAQPLSATAQQKIDAHIRKLDKAFEQRVAEAVQKGTQESMAYAKAYWEKNLAKLAKDVEYRKGVMTKAEYNVILFAIHPDRTPTIEERTEAFRVFNHYKVRLLAEKDHPVASTLPTTVEDLLARRNAKR